MSKRKVTTMAQTYCWETVASLANFKTHFKLWRLIASFKTRFTSMIIKGWHLLQEHSSVNCCAMDSQVRQDWSLHDLFLFNCSPMQAKKYIYISAQFFCLFFTCHHKNRLSSIPACLGQAVTSITSTIKEQVPTPESVISSNASICP